MAQGFGILHPYFFKWCHTCIQILSVLLSSSSVTIQSMSFASGSGGIFDSLIDSLISKENMLLKHSATHSIQLLVESFWTSKRTRSFSDDRHIKLIGSTWLLTLELGRSILEWKTGMMQNKVACRIEDVTGHSIFGKFVSVECIGWWS